MAKTALLTLSLLAGSGCSALPFQESVPEKTTDFTANIDPERYSFQEALEGLDCKYEFELPLEAGADLAAVPAVRVFADAAFTQEVPSETVQEEGEDGPCLKVMPANVSAWDERIDAEDTFVDIFHKEKADEYNYANAGRWYGYGGYYLVRYVGVDGRALEKPEVIYFTVEDDVDSEENRMEDPLNVRMSVTENGSLSVTWDPVEGAA